MTKCIDLQYGYSSPRDWLLLLSSTQFTLAEELRRCILLAATSVGVGFGLPDAAIACNTDYVASPRRGNHAVPKVTGPAHWIKLGRIRPLSGRAFC